MHNVWTHERQRRTSVRACSACSPSDCAVVATDKGELAVALKLEGVLHGFGVQMESSLNSTGYVRARNVHAYANFSTRATVYIDACRPVAMFIAERWI